MNYPRTCIRGIPNSLYMEDDFPNADLFKQFDENPERTDDFNEISISWEDDDGAIQTIMEQKGSIFNYGTDACVSSYMTHTGVLSIRYIQECLNG